MFRNLPDIWNPGVSGGLRLVLVLFGYYSLRLFDYQVLEGASYLARSEENRTTRVIDTTQRGIIYDRNGSVLARNVPSYNVVVTPAFLPATLPFLYEDDVRARSRRFTGIFRI